MQWNLVQGPLFFIFINNLPEEVKGMLIQYPYDATLGRVVNSLEIKLKMILIEKW